MNKLIQRGLLLAQKHSPEILLVSGVITVAGATVLACKATLKAQNVIDEHRNKMDKIKEARDDEQITLEEYSDKDYQRDLTVTYIQTGVNFLKLYGPSLTLYIAGTSMIIAGHGIMKKRNVALMAAYRVLEEGFNTYRKRVIEDYGKEKDYLYKNNLREAEIEVEETDANGKTKKVKKKSLIIDENSISGYGRIMDAKSSQWKNDINYLLMFLQGQQNYWNDVLRLRGHVFLSEIYDALGFERTPESIVVGWVYDEEHIGDQYISFVRNVNGQMVDNISELGDDVYAIDPHYPIIPLDFNVDGPIWDKI